ncbi:hypothetical protein ACIQF6_33965 [Kitasatospora sp. NPDC092948]|uniref:hypothetical protein n=1 Tax=Kitasatospora sp. NPDC092948 TaxID=3364088 RepID=UPI00382C563E
MKYRARTATPARRAHYDADSYRRWVARQIGPRQVGGIYRSGYAGAVYEVLAIDPGPRIGAWPVWRITVRLLGATAAVQHCTAWEARDQVLAEPGESALTYWAEHILDGPVLTAGPTAGALLEQRHLLDEVAHPEQVAVFRHLAAA